MTHSESQNPKERKWQFLSDEKLHQDIRSFEASLAINQSLYHSILAQINPDETNVEVETLIDTLIDNMERIEMWLNALLNERAYREENDIFIKSNEETPRERIQQFQTDVKTMSIKLLTEVKDIFESAIKSWKSTHQKIKVIQAKYRELGLIGDLEQANAKFLEAGRELETTKAILDIIQAELELRSSIAYKIGFIIGKIRLSIKGRFR